MGPLTWNHDRDFCRVFLTYMVVEVDHAIFPSCFQMCHIDSLECLGELLQVSNKRLARHGGGEEIVLVV